MVQQLKKSFTRKSGLFYLMYVPDLIKISWITLILKWIKLSIVVFPLNTQQSLNMFYFIFKFPIEKCSDNSFHVPKTEETGEIAI